MHKRKILYVGYSANMGGIERFVINVCKNLDKNKFEISFLVFKGKAVCYQDKLEEMGIKFFQITKRADNYFAFLHDLKRVYQENNFDIIHFNIMSFDCFERIRMAAQYSNAKLIVHSHSGEIKNIPKKTYYLDKIGRFLTHNIVYEKIACGQEAGKWIFNSNDFLILNNGIDIDSFKFNTQNRKEIRSQIGIKDNDTVIGLSARLEEQKNHKFLIDIFYEYQKLNIDSKLLLIGEGTLRGELEQQVKRLGIDDKVLFLGKRNDMEKIYSSMDVFVMPSWFEGLSIAIVEAQVNGLKCYTSTNVSKESNVTGNVQFLSLDESAKYWAKKIYETDNSRDEDAIEKVPNKFKIEETIRVLNKIYGENER